MCITNNLQRHIRNLTNDGEAVARFLYDTLQGKHPDAKYHHKLEAAKLLERYNPSDEDTPNFWGLIPTPEELAEKNRNNEPQPVRPEPVEGRVRRAENSELNTQNSPVTHLDFLNYDIAHLIRQETADGHTITEFLAQVMTGRDKPFTPKKLRIRQTDRMAASREIIRRGFGHFGRRRKLVADDFDDTNAYDTLHTDLAKRMREYTEHGTEAVRFLLDVMTDADPEDPYSWHHRVSAALELTRRGWDTNYDNITPEMLQAYWQDQHSTRLSVGHKKHLAGLPAFVDDYDAYDTTDYAAIAADLREQEALAAEDLHPSNSPFPPRGKVRKGEENPESSPSRNLPGRKNGKHSPLSPRARATSLPLRRQGVKGSENTPSPSMGKEHAPSESRGWDGGDAPIIVNPPYDNAVSQKVDEPVGNGESSINSLGENEKNAYDHTPTDSDPNLDYYYKPLNPQDQAIFDYELRLESGDHDQSEISFTPPSPAAWRDYELALAHLRETAASEGIPLLPNPLAGTLRRPNIRSP